MRREGEYKNKNAFSHAKLPKAGLGNKLFVWAKAMIFAKLNHLPLVVTGWSQFQLAPVLHGGDFRFYWKCFRSVREVNWFRRSIIRFQASIVNEPPLSALGLCGQSKIYRFSKVPHWADYFGDLRPHREVIRVELLKLLASSRQQEFARMLKPQICVHVRMSDFRPLKQGEDFKKVGGVRTPLAYFIAIIEGIRELHKAELSVLVFSDGRRDDLRELLAIPGVNMAPRNTAIVDILVMANSQVLIPSAGSTFGYWAGFLGNNALILHPDHIHQSVRPPDVNQHWFEGAAIGRPSEWSPLLKANIAEIGVA